MQLHILKNMYCIFLSILGGCSVTLGETNTLGACLVKVTVRRSCTLPRSEDLSEPSPPSVFSKAEEATTLKQDHPHVSMRSRFQVLWTILPLTKHAPRTPYTGSWRCTKNDRFWYTRRPNFEIHSALLRTRIFCQDYWLGLTAKKYEVINRVGLPPGGKSNA